MRRIVRTPVMALVMALALIGAACAADSGDDEGYTLGYSAPFLFSPFEVLQQEAVVAEAESRGMTALPATNADGDSAKQDSDMRNLISGGADGLIVVVNDSKAIIPVLDYAAEQDVKVVSIDIGPDGGHVDMIVRANNIGMGEIACEAMAEAIGYEGKVLSLQGAFTTINGRERSEGFAACIGQYADIELIERATDWDAAKQVEQFQTVLTANPDLRGVFQQSDYALDATLNVLVQAGRTEKVGEEGHIYTISVDATPRALELIREGVLDASISQPINLYATYGIDYLLRALDGETFEVGPTDHDSEIIMFNGNLMDLVPATLVTADNVDDDSLWSNNAE